MLDREVIAASCKLREKAGRRVRRLLDDFLASMNLVSIFPLFPLTS